METKVKRITILDIIRDNAEVLIVHNNPNYYQDTYDIAKCKVASVLVNASGVVKNAVALTNEHLKGMLIYKRVEGIYASEQDLLNENPIYGCVDEEWLKEKYGLDRPVYYIDHKKQIGHCHHGFYVSHINLLTDEITYNKDMTDYFFTVEELKASRPDLFPVKKKVKVTKTYEVEVSKDEAEGIVSDPEQASHYDGDNVEYNAEIID